MTFAAGRRLPLTQILGHINSSRSSKYLSQNAHLTTSHLRDDDFGDYSIILPEEPFVFGVSHIRPRTVPSGIVRPPYAIPGRVKKENDPKHGDPYEGDGIIQLGGEDERRLRNAAKLAKKVRDYAGTLVKVIDRYSLVAYTTTHIHF